MSCWGGDAVDMDAKVGRESAAGGWGGHGDGVVRRMRGEEEYNQGCEKQLVPMTEEVRRRRRALQPTEDATRKTAQQRWRGVGSALTGWGKEEDGVATGGGCQMEEWSATGAGGAT
jgi:hypothetical protein